MNLQLSIYFLAIFTLLNSISTVAQDSVKEKKSHWGFNFGLNYLVSNIEKSDWNQQNINYHDSLNDITSTNTVGFSLGLFNKYKLSEKFHIKIHGVLSFYGENINYKFKDSVHTESSRTTALEFPVHFIYQPFSQKHKPFIFLGGAFGLFLDNNKNQSGRYLKLNKSNFTLDFGIGCEIDFNILKFTPEIKYSVGLSNLLDSKYNSIYNNTLSKLKRNAVVLTLNFE